MLGEHQSNQARFYGWSRAGLITAAIQMTPVLLSCVFLIVHVRRARNGASRGVQVSLEVSGGQVCVLGSAVRLILRGVPSGGDGRRMSGQFVAFALRDSGPTRHY